MRLFFLQKFHFLYILYNVLKGGRLFRVLRTKQKRGPKNDCIRYKDGQLLFF